MKILGLDIGGANIKAAHSNGEAALFPFRLWRHPEKLTDQLRSLRDDFPESDRWHVTMTGELCDCFATKKDGVSQIIDSVLAVDPTQNCWFWSTGGIFLSASLAAQNYLSVAAANWHALGSVIAARYYPDTSGILLDIGSTTTDIIPLSRGLIATDSKTDTERLRRRELAYTGVGRSTVSSIVRSVPLAGSDCPIASEYFADIRDVHVVLGWRQEDHLNCKTADDRPLSLKNSRARLARIICSDNTLSSDADIQTIADAIAQSQLAQIRSALLAVATRITPVETLTICGSGDYLAQRLVNTSSIKATALSETLGRPVSESACAWALTQLPERYDS
ncbi:MAG: hydantoinase/oxoprolinase family protein [Planctomycetota bacterium]|nr:hydantoinase/oxoprolinase family protein [Planctomycetota bacterium]